MALIPLNHEVSLFDESGMSLPCVGTILSSYLILTVANCLYGKSQNKLNMTAKTASGPNSNSSSNSNSTLEEEQIRNVSRVIFHPGFKNASLENDLAILILDKDLDVVNPNSTAKIMPVLNMMNKHPNESTFMNFSGRLCREDLVLAPLKFSNLSQCSNSTRTFTRDKWCNFVSVKSKEKTSGGTNPAVNCSSPLPGSGLICSGKNGHGQLLCGIASSTFERNQGGNGPIYTKIGAHLKWIYSTSFDAKAAKPRGQFVNFTSVEQLNQTQTKEDGLEWSNYDDYDVGVHTIDVKGFPDYIMGAMVHNGTTVKEREQVPYQLSLQYQVDPLKGQWLHICGGVILDEATAITAAHCFDNRSTTPHHYRVVAGVNRLDASGREKQVLTINKFIISKYYTHFSLGDDIAMLHVHNFQFNSHVQPVWLSPFSKAQHSGMEAVINGWGYASNKTILSNSLQKGNVQILPPTDCLDRLKNKKQVLVRDGVVCTLNRYTRTCKGDSGGPLILQNHTVGLSTGNWLVGVLSFGAIPCTRPGTAGFFTEIGYHYDWIQENRAKPLALCGGNYEVDGELEIVYQVPPELRGQKTVCVWVVAAVEGSQLEIRVLSNPNATFQAPESNIYAVYDFSVDTSYYNDITFREYGSQLLIQPFAALYFRTNSTAPNTGFHIQLKEVGKRGPQKIVDLWELKMEEDKNGVMSTQRDFKYPPTPAIHYANDERTFIIIKPRNRHARIKLDLKFVDFEERRDWMEIVAVQSVPLTEFRYSGEITQLNMVFEGEEDEPFIIYFHSDGANTKSGFEFSYSEVMSSLEEYVHASTVQFYASNWFSGARTVVEVESFNCLEIPSGWRNNVSSLKSSSCVTFYEDPGCSGRRRELTRSHADLSQYDMDNLISSYELCWMTAKRNRSPFFVTAYENDNFRGDSIKISFTCGCTGFPAGWNDRIKSIKNLGNICIIGYVEGGCKGNQVRITADYPNFHALGINSTLTSFRFCHEKYHKCRGT